MPNFCAVVGCGSRGDRDRNSFHKIPAIPKKGNSEIIALKTERRIKWIAALRRKDLTETKLKYGSICDRHFISGRPAQTKDVTNLDWVPSQNMGYKTKKMTIQCLKYMNQVWERDTSNPAIITTSSEVTDEVQSNNKSTKVTTQPYLIFLKTEAVDSLTEWPKIAVA